MFRAPNAATTRTRARAPAPIAVTAAWAATVTTSCTPNSRNARQTVAAATRDVIHYLHAIRKISVIARCPNRRPPVRVPPTVA